MTSLWFLAAAVAYCALAAVWITSSDRRDRGRFRAFFYPPSGRAVSVFPEYSRGPASDVGGEPSCPWATSADVLSSPAVAVGREPAVPAGPTRRAVEATLRPRAPLPPARRPLPVDVIEPDMRCVHR